MNMPEKIKLVLDIDNTLLVSVPIQKWPKMPRLPDDIVIVRGEIFGIYFRPFLGHFLECCQQWFEVMIWTAGVEEYARSVVNILFPGERPKPLFYHRDHCTYVEGVGSGYVKDLRKINGFNKEKILLLDDQKGSFYFNPANGLELPFFEGDICDVTLYFVLPHLWSIYKNGKIIHEDWSSHSLKILEKYEQDFLNDCPPLETPQTAEEGTSYLSFEGSGIFQ
jgi:carboxy-terminal domain RNA polymerase II polypeptide A small phosphatase